MDTLPTSPLPNAAPSPAWVTSTEHPGEQVGPFTLLSIIGQGGFGTVWLAERREPMVQRVALKIIKPGMDSAGVIARFEQERQALAVMDHPSVARIFDGGVSQRGRPYFAMEYVEGEPITTFCDKQNQSIDQRLELFVQVCEAVQHAHMKGIIHRDLKPSNILVELRDGRAIPKVIDFGVAKAINSTVTQHAVFTEAGQLIGTPEYMSPEQAEMSSLDVDTRSDVYSLGVVLYELLTGLLPFDSRELRSKGYAEIQRFIRETDPPRPSTRLSTIDDATGVTIARCRQEQREHLASHLRRELEWIPLKAMRKDRAERYRTPIDMAEDVRRFLRSEPIEAAPESAAYRARKFVRRHRPQVVGASVVLLALLAGLGGTLWQAKIARAQRDAAIAARKRAETITEFVTTTMQSADPTESGSQQTTILQAMDAASRDIKSGRFKDDPETEAALKATIGTILLSNGRAEEARGLFTEALDARKKLFTGDHLDLASSLDDLGYTLQALGKGEEAEKLYHQALEMRRRLLPPDDKAIAVSLNHVAYVNSELGRDEEAVKYYTLALDMSRRLHADDRTIAENLAGLAVATESAGRVADAEPLEVQTLEIFRRLYPGDHPNVATSLNNLAFTRNLLGRTEDAEKLFRESLEMRRRIYKGDHAEIANSLKNLGGVYEELHRAPDAEAMYTQALEMDRRLFKGDHPSTAMAITSLASSQESQGRFTQAEANYTLALEMMQRLYKGDHPSVAACLSNLGYIRNQMGHPETAEPPYVESVEMHKRLYPGDHRQTVSAMIGLAYVRQALQHYDQAGAMYKEAIAMNRRLYPGDHPITLSGLNNYCGMLLQQGNASVAEPIAAEALAMSRRLFKDDNPEVANCLTNVANVEQLQGHHAEARAHYDQALVIRRAAAPNGSANLARLIWRSGLAHMETGNQAAAQAELEEAMPMAEKYLPQDSPQLKEYREALDKCRQAAGGVPQK